MQYQIVKNICKERFVALLNEMRNDNNAGLIPSMIAEGVKECDAYCKDEAFLDYWVINAFYAK